MSPRGEDGYLSAGLTRGGLTQALGRASKIQLWERYSVAFDRINAARYYLLMIRSFADKEAEKLFNRQFSRKLPPEIQHTARLKLEILDAAERLDDLRVPPSNRLEKLSGDRTGQSSIRINKQWRICFVWRDNGPCEVEIVDYH